MTKTRQQGFGLAEVLVTSVIISVGLLALVKLQGTAQKHNHDAFLQVKAVLLAREMAERIIANSAGKTNYVGLDCANPPSKPSVLCVQDEIPNFNSNNIPNCTPAQMATYDKWRWCANIKLRLPVGKGRIKKTGGIYTITVSWNERTNKKESSTGRITKSYNLDFKP